MFFRQKNFFIKKIRLNNTKKIAKKLIEYIDNDSKSYKFGTVSKTSWNSEKIPPHELKIFYYENFHKSVKKSIGIDCAVDLVWYQKYDKKSFSYHRYHDHYNKENSHLSGIFYAKLKHKKLRTKFLINEKIFIPRVFEGDVIIFDSRIPHTSPPNDTDDDKIIFSFNINTFGNYPKTIF